MVSNLTVESIPCEHRFPNLVVDIVRWCFTANWEATWVGGYINSYISVFNFNGAITWPLYSPLERLRPSRPSLCEKMCWKWRMSFELKLWGVALMSFLSVSLITWPARTERSSNTYFVKVFRDKFWKETNRSSGSRILNEKENSLQTISGSSKTTWDNLS